ncbi:hypothetical protein VPHK567_0302 [Vibrio phage K567]
MNRKLALVAAFAAFALTGCNDVTLATTTNEKILAVRDVLNHEESVMINRWLELASRDSYLYDDMWAALATRNKYGGTANQRSNSELPFCDVIEGVVKSEKRIRDSFKGTLSNQWKTKYGLTLAQQCDYTPPLTKKEKIALIEEREIDLQLEEAKTSQPKTMNEVVDSVNTLLDPHEYDYLIESARECKRAKVKLLSLTNVGQPLTIQDGDDARKLIIECKMHKLEVELNK